MANTFEARRDVYTELWASMEINEDRKAIISRQADKIISFKTRYDPIEKATGVPWYLIGLMHLRESNFDFNTHLHNGDSLNHRTVHVPAGRPITGNPPFTFEESAIDALKQKNLDKIKDWSIERVAYTLELFNGFGYVAKQINSPYLWAGTNHYTRGKYIRDHVFSASTVDTQLGTMAVIRLIFDKIGLPSRKSHTEIAKSAPKAEAERPTTKELVKVSRKAWWTDIQNKVLTFFGLGVGGERALTFADVESTKSTLDTVRDFVVSNGVVILLVLAAGLLAINLWKMKLQKDDIQEGRSVPSGEEE